MNINSHALSPCKNITSGVASAQLPPLIVGRKKFSATGLCLFICTLLASNCVLAAELKTSLGINYFSGDYDQERTTTILHSAFDLRYRDFPWEFRAALPWLKIDGYGGIDGNGNIIGDGSGERRVDTGIGDIPLSLSYYQVPSKQQGLFAASLFKFTARIKLPTADENKGLGTGEFDYTLEIQWIKKIEKFSPFVGLGYTHVGKTSDSILKNRFYTQLGTVYQKNAQLNLGLMYSYKQASSENRANDQKLITFINWKVPQSAWAIEGYALKGLSKAAADFAAGFSLAYYFQR